MFTLSAVSEASLMSLLDESDRGQGEFHIRFFCVSNFVNIFATYLADMIAKLNLVLELPPLNVKCQTKFLTNTLINCTVQCISTPVSSVSYFMQTEGRHLPTVQCCTKGNYQIFCNFLLSPCVPD